MPYTPHKLKFGEPLADVATATRSPRAGVNHGKSLTGAVGHALSDQHRWGLYKKLTIDRLAGPSNPRVYPVRVSVGARRDRRVWVEELFSYRLPEPLSLAIAVDLIMEFGLGSQAGMVPPTAWHPYLSGADRLLYSVGERGEKDAWGRYQEYDVDSIVGSAAGWVRQWSEAPGRAFDRAERVLREWSRLQGDYDSALVAQALPHRRVKEEPLVLVGRTCAKCSRPVAARQGYCKLCKKAYDRERYERKAALAAEPTVPAMSAESTDEDAAAWFGHRTWRRCTGCGVPGGIEEMGIADDEKDRLRSKCKKCRAKVERVRAAKAAKVSTRCHCGRLAAHVWVVGTTRVCLGCMSKHRVHRLVEGGWTPPEGTKGKVVRWFNEVVEEVGGESV